MRRRPGFRASVALALALPLALAGCFGSSEPAKCPHITILNDLKSVAKFGPGPGRAATDIQYGSRMIAATVTCSGDKKRGGVMASTKLGIVSLRGNPAIRQAQVVYFVAVVDRRQNVLVKRQFTINLKFSPTEIRVEGTEFLDTFIPLPPNGSGDDYGIIFGFELTPDELQYNRTHEG